MMSVSRRVTQKKISRGINHVMRFLIPAAEVGVCSALLAPQQQVLSCCEDSGCVSVTENKQRFVDRPRGDPLGHAVTLLPVTAFTLVLCVFVSTRSSGFSSLPDRQVMCLLPPNPHETL